MILHDKHVFVLIFKCINTTRAVLLSHLKLSVMRPLIVSLLPRLDNEFLGCSVEYA